MRKPGLAALIIILSFIGALAQNDAGGLIRGSVKDAGILLEGYAGPAMKAIGYGLNQGWYNTAKPHDKFGVDITFNGSLMYVPTSDMYYLVDNTKLQDVSLVEYDNKIINPDTGTGNVPTIFGPDKQPTYQYDETGDTFNTPGGIDLQEAIKLANALPVPMYQAGLGLPKGFDIKVRFSPTVKLQDFRFNLWGVGLLHDVGQYIPGIKALPVDISLFAGYTKVEAEQDLSGIVAGQNQKAVLEFNSTTVQALVSKKIKFLTFYGGLGYNFINSSLAAKGTYDLDDDGNIEPDEIPDPINLDFSTSGFRATGGMRIKFAVFTLHADYTFAEYNSLTAGFGINVR